MWGAPAPSLSRPQLVRGLHLASTGDQGWAYRLGQPGCLHSLQGCLCSLVLLIGRRSGVPGGLALPAAPALWCSAVLLCSLFAV